MRKERYETERKKLTEEVHICEQGIREYNENTRSANWFVRLVDQYADFEEPAEVEKEHKCKEKLCYLSSSQGIRVAESL
ncbi:MAG: hypothetical protein IJV50_05210 [Lachnospiraceae bacterium]|nr:hypothetical protein [Lachnospiraceae bacterium]